MYNSSRCTVFSKTTPSPRLYGSDQSSKSQLVTHLQDFMGFLHLGWDIAAKEDVSDQILSDYGPAWVEVAKHVDLARPGMSAVIRTMGWQPLHVAAMEGKVSLVTTLVQQLGCNILGRSANSWTPMHYAAAHNQVKLHDSCCWQT